MAYHIQYDVAKNHKFFIRSLLGTLMFEDRDKRSLQRISLKKSSIKGI